MAKEAILSLSSPMPTTAYRLTLSELDLHRGDVVITSDQEHPSTLQTLDSLKQRGIELIVIPASSEGRFLSQLDDICKERKTRLISLSHVAHSDGRVFPLQSAYRQIGVLAIVANGLCHL